MSLFPFVTYEEDVVKISSLSGRKDYNCARRVV